MIHLEAAGGGGGLQVQLYVPQSANQAPELEFVRQGAALTPEQLRTIERGMRAATVTAELDDCSASWVRRPLHLLGYGAAPRTQSCLNSSKGSHSHFLRLFLT